MGRSVRLRIAVADALGLGTLVATLAHLAAVAVCLHAAPQPLADRGRARGLFRRRLRRHFRGGGDARRRRDIVERRLVVVFLLGGEIEAGVGGGEGEGRHCFLFDHSLQVSGERHLGLATFNRQGRVGYAGIGIQW